MGNLVRPTLAGWDMGKWETDGAGGLSSFASLHVVLLLYLRFVAVFTGWGWALQHIIALPGGGVWVGLSVLALRPWSPKRGRGGAEGFGEGEAKCHPQTDPVLVHVYRSPSVV